MLSLPVVYVVFPLWNVNMAIVKAERVRYFSHLFSDAKNKENFTGTNFRKPNFATGFRNFL